MNAIDCAMHMQMQTTNTAHGHIIDFHPTSLTPVGVSMTFIGYQINDFYRISSIPVGISLIFIRHH